jgi:predicted RNase H-like HicB family nuclease
MSLGFTPMAAFQKIRSVMEAIRHAAGDSPVGGFSARPDGSEVTGKFNFKVQVTPDELDGGYVVECLNLPGCVSEGETVEEALDNLADAIAGVMITRFEERLPPTTSVSAERCERASTITVPMDGFAVAGH